MNGLEKLTEALELPLASAGVVLLFNFEDCGSCASHRIATEDFSPADWFLTFHEQTGEYAYETGELQLNLGYFSDEEHKDDTHVRELIRQAFLNGGYEVLPGDKTTPRNWDIKTRLKFNTFQEDASGFVVFDMFPPVYQEDDEL